METPQRVPGQAPTAGRTGVCTEHPEAAAIIAGVLLPAGLVVLLFLLVSRIRRFLGRRAQRREERRPAHRTGGPPG